MSETKLDLTRPVRMKDGTPVEIVCSDLAEPMPLLITYLNGIGNKTASRRTLNGRSDPTERSDYDLENVPETYDTLVSFYGNDSSTCHARIKVKVEVGRFDD